jgi:hypothetical protein
MDVNITQNYPFNVCVARPKMQPNNGWHFALTLKSPSSKPPPLKRQANSSGLRKIEIGGMSFDLTKKEGFIVKENRCSTSNEICWVQEFGARLHVKVFVIVKGDHRAGH